MSTGPRTYTAPDHWENDIDARMKPIVSCEIVGLPDKDVDVPNPSIDE